MGAGGNEGGGRRESRLRFGDVGNADVRVVAAKAENVGVADGVDAELGTIGAGKRDVGTVVGGDESGGRKCGVTGDRVVEGKRVVRDRTKSRDGRVMVIACFAPPPIEISTVSVGAPKVPAAPVTAV